MSENRPLPEGWFSSVDPSSGQTYYYQDGGEPQWNFPGDPAPEEAANVGEQVTEPIVPEAKQEPVVAEPVPEAVVQAQPMTGGSGGSGGKAATGGLLSVALFPFTGMIPLLIWIICHAALALMEIISGFCSLGQYYQITKRDVLPVEKKSGLLAAFLIVDGFVIAIDCVTHLLLMVKPAKRMLNNPPSIEQLKMIPFANGNIFFPGESSEKTQFIIRMIIMLVIRVFQFIWLIVGTFDATLRCYYIYLYKTIGGEKIPYQSLFANGTKVFAAVAIAIGWFSVGAQALYLLVAHQVKRHFVSSTAK
ncbi:uncharacterized protein MONOS_3038 [Monocercomonoides exilis]|uniref:uncharacterized protein n=1 Tax=Monocercomonoides exilis TaxID=2049356 RepID=UPI00355A3F23|nr:hypothetical protein MONOS_3038 [Monocercomonoides exilis]|eukprot:MONOS_3038.1-p1 / transcript=MONOS_3038.1 / gene=MONOS_3038 / organism=Monocercomonoides_exilis_PA203 / gene_product=unspecified product / transcript_product=unspecified product / location=Mono_scaffold00067:111940-113131(+) / protein_length=305 / sequence_SO=supercontig / SO=protein_coding / is_pseudo=false